MKIAVWHNLPSGGGKRALYDHVRGLVARGHRVEAWRPPTANADYLPLGQLIREHVVDLRQPERQWRDRLTLTPWIERRVEAMEDHCRRCAAEISRGGFDILFANSCLFFATSPIGRHVDVPSVLYLQEPYRPLYEATPRSKWLAPPRSNRSPLHPATWRNAFHDWRKIDGLRVQAREEVDNAAGFTRILVNSQFSRESLLRAYGLDSDVCYLGVDTDHFAVRNLPREDYVVGLGSIQPAKNLRLCIEAVGALAAPRPRLVWIGNFVHPSWHLDEMRALAGSLRVEFEAKILVSDEELLDTLGRATAMLYAPRLEPFGLAPLEANACGVPVIAVAEGGVRETIVDGVNGLLVSHDPGAMAAAIARLRADPEFARALGANARRHVEEKWGLDSAANRLEQRLEQYAAVDARDSHAPLRHSS